MNGPSALRPPVGTLRFVAPSRSERLLDDDYLGDLTARPLDEIRRMRAECQSVEVGLSYLRRLVQGRIDIVAAHQQRRAGGGGDLSSLVDALPGILAEHTHAGGPGRLPTLMAPSDDDEAELAAELDAIVAPGELASLDRASDDDLARMLDSLTALERAVSRRRRALHERIDALQAELTRRYKSGEASVEALLS